MYKKVLVIFAIVSLALVYGARAETKISFKVGFVDIQKALNSCEAGKTAAAELNKDLEKAMQKYQAEGQALQKEKEALDKQGTLMDENAMKDKMRDFQAKYRDWERFRRDTENDIRQKHNEMVEKITKELVEICEQMGTEGGYTMILERSMVPYIEKGLEMTDELVKRHNQKYAAKKK